GGGGTAAGGGSSMLGGGGASIGGGGGTSPACPDCTPNTACLLRDGGAGMECSAWSDDITCVDPSTDPLNCGYCGKPGLTDTHCHPQPGTYCVVDDCSHARSTDSCLLGDGGLGGCCEGQCRDPSAFAGDTRNCGICGLACAPGVACAFGTCDTGCTGSC